MTDDETIAAGRQRIEELLAQAAACAIPDGEFVELFGLCHKWGRAWETAKSGLLDQRLALSVNSYLHTLRLACDYQDVTVDFQTASRLKAGLEARQPLTNEDIRLLGRRGVDQAAEAELFTAFMRLIGTMEGQPIPPHGVVPVQYYTLLSEEQFALLASNIFEQAVVHSTINVTDKAYFARGAAESPDLKIRLELANLIGLHNETYRWILPKPNLTPAERKAEADWVEDLCRRAQEPETLTQEECHTIFNHQPTTLLLKSRLWAAAPLGAGNFPSIFSRATRFHPAGGEC